VEFKLIISFLEIELKFIGYYDINSTILSSVEQYSTDVDNNY